MTSAEAVLVNSTNAPQQYLATTPTKRIRNRARSGSTSRKIRRTSGMSSPSSAAAAAAAAASGKSKPASARASASARTNSNADADATRIKKDASLTFEPCSLGLRRILGGPDDRKNDNGAHQQQQPARGELPAAPLIPIGPPIGLCKGMWLGRTPLSVLKAIKSHKSLDATWSARDMTDFRKKHASIYRQYALLGIDWGDQSNNSNSSSNNSSNSNINSNSNSNGLREVTKKKSLMAVSRKLLTVVDASDTTLTLQRGKEMETTPNQTEARIVDVAVIKRRESSRSSSSKANNAYDFVPPESRVVLHEGDILKILNSTYRYQVVRFHDRNRNRNRNGTTASAQAAAAAAAAGIETIDLAHASFSSSGSDNEREVRKPAAAGPKSSSSSSLSNPVGVAQSKRKLRPDRRSSASAMDRTVAMPDEGIASESNSPKSEEEDGKPRARPRARSEPLSPDRSQSGNDIIDLLDTSDSSSENSSSSSSSSSRSRSSSESNHGFDTPTTDRKRLLSVSIADNSEKEKKKTAKPATNSNSNSSSNIHDASTIRQSQSIGNGAASEIEIEIKLDGTREGASNECPASKTPTDQVTSSMQPKTGRSVKVKADNGLPAISARTGADPATTIRKSKRISNRAQHEERIVKTKTNLETTTTKIEKDNNGNTKNSIPSLRSRLSKPGLRIEKVILLDEVVSTTITTKGSTSKAVSKKTADKRSYGKLDELPVVCPVFKFWDPSWGSSTAVEKASPDPEEGAPPLSIVSSSSTSAPPSASPPRKRRKKQLPPRDLPVSLANIYWKSLNSSRPREGACYLHTTMVAANTIPSSSMCQQWMELLTWGPRRTVTNPKSPTGFFWDGPRMEHAAEVWKQALQTNPSLLLPRMIASAPGGPSEWWKTCLEYNDLLAENDRHAVVGSANAAASEEQTMHRAIGLLRMRSTRLETLIVLLKSNIAFEEEYYRYERIRNEREQKQASTTERVVRENNSTTTNNNNNKDPNPTTGHESEADSSDDDDDTDDEGIDDENEPKHSIAETEREAVAETLVFLREIRGVGAKPVLRLVAQTMARFWLENKEFLGYYNADDDDDDSSDRDHLWWSLWQERSEIVREMASQIMEVLRLMQDILHHTNDAVQQALLPRRTRKRKNASSSSGMTEKDIRDVVWSAMDLEVKQHQLHLPASSFQRKKPKPKRAANDEPTAIDCFLLDWLLALRTSLGDTLVANLAVQFGIAKDYNAVVAL
eukprot:jgi/Psemu1/23927/gm1.23927_g